MIMIRIFEFVPKKICHSKIGMTFDKNLKFFETVLITRKPPFLHAVASRKRVVFIKINDSHHLTVAVIKRGAHVGSMLLSFLLYDFFKWFENKIKNCKLIFSVILVTM